MAINDLVKKMLSAAALAGAMSGCATGPMTSDNAVYTRQAASAQYGTTRPTTSTSDDDENTNAIAARNAQRGLQYDPVHGYTPQEDRDFSAGMNQQHYDRYGGHRADNK